MSAYGKATGPIRFHFLGDEPAARQYIGQGRAFLGRVKEFMRLSEIKSYQSEAVLHNNDTDKDIGVIKAQSNNNGLAAIDEVWITVPKIPKEKKKKEKRIIAFDWYLQDSRRTQGENPGGAELWMFEPLNTSGAFVIVSWAIPRTLGYHQMEYGADGEIGQAQSRISDEFYIEWDPAYGSMGGAILDGTRDISPGTYAEFEPANGTYYTSAPWNPSYYLWYSPALNTYFDVWQTASWGPDTPEHTPVYCVYAGGMYTGDIVEPVLVGYLINLYTYPPEPRQIHTGGSGFVVSPYGLMGYTGDIFDDHFGKYAWNEWGAGAAISLRPNEKIEWIPVNNHVEVPSDIYDYTITIADEHLVNDGYENRFLRGWYVGCVTMWHDISQRYQLPVVKTAVKISLSDGTVWEKELSFTPCLSTNDNDFKGEMLGPKSNELIFINPQLSQLAYFTDMADYWAEKFNENMENTEKQSNFITWIGIKNNYPTDKQPDFFIDFKSEEFS